MTELTPPTIAMIQMTSGIDADANLAVIDRAMNAAAQAGAAMAFLPEMSLLLDRDRQRSAGAMTREADSPWLAQLCAMAVRHGLWLHSGSMPLLTDDGAKRINRSHVIAADGTVRAHYDKIHLFDVDLATGESWRESSSYRGGDSLVVVDTPVGRLGLSICYDIRFGELYRTLADRGATIIAVPAAFTVPTGKAHWHVLLRARAIETGCHIIAAAQSGDHADGRSTFGHSLAIDPWGAVLAEAEASPPNDFTLSLAAVDPDAQRRAQVAIPLRQSRAIRQVTL